MIIAYTKSGIIYIVQEKDDEELVYRQEDNKLLAEGDQIHITKEEVVCTKDGDPVWQARLSVGQAGS